MECINSLAIDDMLGRPFQSLERATRNLRSPMVALHTHGTSSDWSPVDVSALIWADAC